MFSLSQREISYPLAITSHPFPSLSHKTWSIINLLSLSICLFCVLHINGMIQYVFSCDWILSLGMIFLRFIMLQHISVLHFLLLPNYIPVYGNSNCFNQEGNFLYLSMSFYYFCLLTPFTRFSQTYSSVLENTTNLFSKPMSFFLFVFKILYIRMIMWCLSFSK